MKKRLTAIVLCFVFILTGVPAWGGSVFAVEKGETTPAAKAEHTQLGMPAIAIKTVSGAAISSGETYLSAELTTINDQGEYEFKDKSVSVKLRGNSSMNSDKKSYKLKFSEKQNLLSIGKGKGKTWCLISNCYDGSLLRNHTAYRFGALLTNISYTPDCRSAELYVNGEYQGVYLLCEDVNVNKDRVAIEEEPEEVEKNGYLVEMSRYAVENKFDLDTATYEVKSDLSENQSIRKKQLNYISNSIKKAYDALNKGNEKEVGKYVDLDSLVDIYIANEIFKNVDAGWDSFYMYKPVDGKLCFGPLWDFDLAMGNANCVKGIESWEGFNPYHVLNLNANSNPWFCRALSQKWFRNLVKKRWNKLQEKIDTLPKSVIKEAEGNIKAYSRNFEKWDVLGRQVYIEPIQITKLTTYKGQYTYLANWLSKRIKWLSKYYNSKDFTNGTFVNEEGEKLTVNYNLLEMSPVLALANSYQDMTYAMSSNTGISMSIKNAGTDSWSTQIVASGFMLEAGAEYILSFDYRCSPEHPVSFSIQQNYSPWSQYFNDTLKMNKNLQHYEVTLKAPAKDINSALAFSLGGSAFNGTDISIDNMSLVKKPVKK